MAVLTFDAEQVTERLALEAEQTHARRKKMAHILGLVVKQTEAQQRRTQQLACRLEAFRSSLRTGNILLGVKISEDGRRRCRWDPIFTPDALIHREYGNHPPNEVAGFTEDKEMKKKT